MCVVPFRANVIPGAQFLADRYHFLSVEVNYLIPIALNEPYRYQTQVEFNEFMIPGARKYRFRYQIDVCRPGRA